MSNPEIRIFLSATTHDLGSYRRAVRDVLRREGYAPIEQADFNAADAALRKSLDDKIASCHAVICLAGSHCGEETLEPDGQTLRSHTQREYHAAVRLGKAVFAYLAGSVCPPDQPHCEPDETAERQRAHRALLEASHHYQSFASRAELELLVTRLAHDELRQMPWDWLYPPKLLTSPLLIRDRQRRPLHSTENLHDEWMVLLPKGGKRRYRTLDEAIAAEPELALIGGAGSGKTIALKQALRHAAERAQRDRSEARPVWLQISEFRCEGPSVARMEEFTEEQLRQILPDPALTPTEIREALFAGRCLLLLDGIDELPRKSWKTRLDSVAAFLETYCGNRLVVSARPGTQLPQSGLPEVRMPSLSRAAQRRLVAALTEGKPEEAARFEVWLRFASEAVRELADNPFFLHALVERFQQKSGSAPEQPAELLLEVLKKRLVDEFSSHGGTGWWAKLTEDGYGNEDMLALCLPALSKLGVRALSSETPDSIPIEIAREMQPDEYQRPGPLNASFLQSAAELGVYQLTQNELVFTHALWRDLLAACELRDRYSKDPEAKLGGMSSATGASVWKQACIFLTQLLLPETLGSHYRRWREANPAFVASIVAEGGALGGDSLRRELAGHFCADIAREANPLCGRRLAALALGRVGDYRIWENAERPLVPAMVSISGGEFRSGLADEDLEKLLPLQEMGGDLELSDGELACARHAVADFCLARFPITNAHFRLFITAGGYYAPGWWDEAGWQWLQAHGAGERRPDHWTDVRYCGENDPLVGVTFHEATAYARWLTAAIHDGRTFRLPTVVEWQAAARGTQGRLYPWGDEPESLRCNCWHAEDLGLISPVGIYLQGNTPEGIHDLAGNVAEWAVPADGAAPVLCGGSWLSSIHGCRATQIRTARPDDSSTEGGFRISSFVA